MSRRVRNISKPMEEIVLYLNTEVNCTKREIAGKNVEFSFNISPLVLNEYCVMKLVSIAHDTSGSSHNTLHGNNVIQFRLSNNIQYNPELYRSNDNSLPIMFAMNWVDNEPAFWDSSLGGVHLNPQTINNITFIVSDSLTNTYGGVNNGLKFLIGLVIIPYDRQYSAIEN
jgi:hypothetical protein